MLTESPPYLGDGRCGMKWLFERREDVRGLRQGPPLARHDDHLGRGPLLDDTPSQGNAVQRSGHLDIGEDEIDVLMRLEDALRLVATDRLQHPEPSFPQRIGQVDTWKQFIFDDQHSRLTMQGRLIRGRAVSQWRSVGRHRSPPGAWPAPKRQLRVNSP